MDARLLQEANGYQLLRELEKLKQTDCRSIAKLMEWVVTGMHARLRHISASNAATGLACVQL
jgi:hypothetical protein